MINPLSYLLGISFPVGILLLGCGLVAWFILPKIADAILKLIAGILILISLFVIVHTLFLFFRI